MDKFSAVSVVTIGNASSLISSITSYLIANLPFILAIVGFGIVARLVLNKIAMKSDFYGGSIHDTYSNYKWSRKNK